MQRFEFQLRVIFIFLPMWKEVYYFEKYKKRHLLFLFYYFYYSRDFEEKYVTFLYASIFVQWSSLWPKPLTQLPESTFIPILKYRNRDWNPSPGFVSIRRVVTKSASQDWWWNPKIYIQSNSKQTILRTISQRRGTCHSARRQILQKSTAVSSPGGDLSCTTRQNAVWIK